MQEPFRVAYFLNVFPTVSETFIINEMVEFKRLGVELSIFALRPGNDTIEHAQVKELMSNVTYVIGPNLTKVRKAWALARMTLSHPWRMFRLLTRWREFGVPGPTRWTITTAITMARDVEKSR